MQRKTELEIKRKEQKEAEKERKFALCQAKKKAKHRGRQQYNEEGLEIWFVTVNDPQREGGLKIILRV